MSRRAYLISFMLLAVTFVPVLFSIICAWMVAPCCFGAFYTVWSALQNWPPENLIFVAIDFTYIAFYCGLFYLGARWTFWISQRMKNPAGRPIFQVAVLLLLFSCSFAPVITGHGLINYTGTYDFWGGCVRFVQTWRSG